MKRLPKLFAVALIGILVAPVAGGSATNASEGRAEENGADVADYLRSLEPGEIADVAYLARHGDFGVDPSATPPESLEPVSNEMFAPSPGSKKGAPGDVTASLEGSGCYYDQLIDYPHKSGGDVSVHGWWNDEGGDCPTYADIDLELQAWYCGNPWGCGYVKVADVHNVRKKARNIWNQRATLRKPCTATHNVSWRAYVDVDLVGQSDPGGATGSGSVVLFCSPT